jgi:type II secretory pathway component GspD/PulD (secretin)
MNSGKFEKNGNTAYRNGIQVGPESDITQNLLGTSNPQFSYLFRNNTVDFTIQALLNKNNVKILSQPRILTSDNEQATLTIGQQKPILKSTTDVSQSNNTVSDFSYINIGISLKITPHINPEKDVTLDMDFKISDVNGYDQFPGSTSGGQVSIPILSNREAQTTVIVKHDYTLVIGGIITKNHTETTNSSPIFGDIPMLGWLFGDETESRTQTELIILVSPYVVDTSEEGEKLTKEEQERVIVRDKDFQDFKNYFIGKNEKRTLNDKIINFFSGELKDKDKEKEKEKKEDLDQDKSVKDEKEKPQNKKNDLESDGDSK